MSVPILGLGFLVGMQHALETDHIAAISSIAARGTRMADVVKHGLTWGLRPYVDAVFICRRCDCAGLGYPGHIPQSLEFAVGVMLVGLGAHVLWRLWRDRVHFHSHPDGTPHVHAHSHASDRVPHGSAELKHTHGFRWRSLVVGLMHGMAGSAALLGSKLINSSALTIRS